MMDPKDTQEKIAELQSLEQNMNSINAQKQTIQAQLVEFETALKELEGTDSAYKIVGNIMISADKAELKKDLESKKEVTELRIKTLDKQEEKIREKVEKTHKEVMEEMQKKGDDDGK